MVDEVNGMPIEDFLCDTLGGNYCDDESAVPTFSESGPTGASAVISPSQAPEGSVSPGQLKALQEWQRLLDAYNNKEVSLSELKDFDTGPLSGIEGWSDYYNNFITSATDDGTEDEDPALTELISQYGEEAVEDAQRKLKELESILNKTIDDPLGTLEGIINKTKSASSGSVCAAADVPTWIRNCVTVGINLPIPFPLPGPLGSIFKGATVGDIEDAIKNAGYEIGKVLSGETSVEEVLDKIVDGVVGKIQGIFGDADEVSVNSILGKIGDILVGGGYILAGDLYDEYFKDKVNSAIPNVPIIPYASSEDCQNSERYTADAEGNCGPCIDPKKTYDPIDNICVDRSETEPYDCAKEDSRKGGVVSDASQCNECLEGYEEDAEGKCVETDSDIGDNGPTAQECLQENREHVAGDDVTDSSCGGCLEGYEENAEGVCEKKSTPVTLCEDEFSTNYGEDGDCGPDCISGYSIKEGATTCSKDDTPELIKCPDDTPNAGQMVTNAADCGEPTTLIKCPDDTPNAGQMVTNAADCGEPTTLIKCPDDTPNAGQMVTSLDECGTTTPLVECPDGSMVTSLDECGTTTPLVECPDGSMVTSLDECGTTTYTCPDPNATTNEDGSCGPCKTGYAYDGSVERCVQSTAPDPCLDAAYAAANPEQCGTGNDCVDCTCAEYAAANPEECATGPETPSGGGGGGCGGSTGGSGMFDLESFEIAGDPQLLARMEFPITNFLEGMFKDYV